METFLLIAIFCLIIVSLILPAVIIYEKKVGELAKLERYWDVEIGMSEYEMLEIMGDGYNRSLLKNNRTKYEWRINGSSYGSSYKGMSARTYTGVKKVTIYTKNGYVEEVKPYNV